MVLHMYNMTTAQNVYNTKYVNMFGECIFMMEIEKMRKRIKF
jgi:hypothetical protein